MRLLLDGQSIEMSLAGKAGKYYQGVIYEASVTGLAWGPHRYQFVGSDGTTEVSTPLNQGPMVEGDDPNWNYAPSLWGGQVDPWQGSPDATYTYSVFYQDEEGDEEEAEVADEDNDDDYGVDYYASDGDYGGDEDGGNDPYF